MTKIGSFSILKINIGNIVIKKIYNGSNLIYLVQTYSPGSNSANFNICADWNGLNGNLTTVGSNGGPSYYGTYDQSGNLREWNDLDDTSRELRGVRGGAWFFDVTSLSSAVRIVGEPFGGNFGLIGFRIASLLNPLGLLYFTLVDDINNNNDSTGYGSVSYAYYIAQYMITNCEYAEFLNRVASTDTYSLYNSSMSSDPRGGITRSGDSGNYTYTVKANMENKPVSFVSWFDCARYCNWLHNKVNDPNSTNTETGAYTLVDGQTSGIAPSKNIGAYYYVPTENEWYKAAYYKGGSIDAGYWTYATQSDNEPTCVTANSSGDGTEISNYVCDLYNLLTIANERLLSIDNKNLVYF